MASRSKSQESAAERLIYNVAQASIVRALAWRYVLATRLIGIRPLDDQAADGLRDLFESVIMLRCEMSALCTALIDAGVIDRADLFRRVGQVAEQVSNDYETVFPGLWADPDGTIQYDETRARKEPPVPPKGQN